MEPQQIPGVKEAPWWDRVIWKIAHELAPWLGETAEELHGAGVVRVVKMLPRYEQNRGNLKAFIGSQARLAMIDHIRDWRHTRRGGQAGITVEPLNGHERSMPAVQAEQVLGGEAWALVTRLPARWAAVVRWYYGPEGLTLRECGERLGVNPSRASQIRIQAIARLREVMGLK